MYDNDPLIKLIRVIRGRVYSETIRVCLSNKASAFGEDSTAADPVPARVLTILDTVSITLTRLLFMSATYMSVATAIELIGYEKEAELFKPSAKAANPLP